MSQKQYGGAIGDHIAKHKGNLVKAWDSCEVIDYLFHLLKIADYSSEHRLAKYTHWCMSTHEMANGKTMTQNANDIPAARLALKQAENQDALLAASSVSKSMVRAAKHIAEEQYSKKDWVARRKPVHKAETAIESAQATMLKQIIQNPFKRKRKAKDDASTESE